jgi:hypothetical protein
MVMSIVRRPNLSGSLVGFVEAVLGTSHSVVACCLGLVVVGWALTGVAPVRVGNVRAVRPTIVLVIVALGVGVALLTRLVVGRLGLIWVGLWIGIGCWRRCVGRAWWVARWW